MLWCNLCLFGGARTGMGILGFRGDSGRILVPYSCSMGVDNVSHDNVALWNERMSVFKVWSYNNGVNV